MNSISVENVSKTFYPSTWRFWRDKSKASAVCALKKVSLTVKRGEITGIIGPNGSGKTTLLKIICGLLLPDEGGVRVMGEDLKKSQPVSHLIGIVFSDRRSFYLTISGYENLLFFATALGVPKSKRNQLIYEAAEWAGITGAFNRRVSSYSGGMITRLALARALLAAPPVLLLDEPTVSLDYEMTARLSQKVAELSQNGVTVVVTSHDLSVIKSWCKTAHIIESGSIAKSLYGAEIETAIDEIKSRSKIAAE